MARRGVNRGPWRGRAGGRPGLTLVELLVVTTIIGVMALVAVTASGRFRELAATQATKLELRDLASAIERYRFIEGTLPAGLEDLTATGYYEKSPEVDYCEFRLYPEDGYVYARAAYTSSKTHVELRYPGSTPVVIQTRAPDDCAT